MRYICLFLLFLSAAVSFACGGFNKPKTVNPDDKAPKVQAPQSPSPAIEKQPEQPPELMVIFQHSPQQSVAQLVKRGSDIPPGWVGEGHVVGIEYGQREFQLGALLQNGKEGETVTCGRLGR